jgi:ElaB/YqjD/DUF883 family membrane-anchored ribosome-binding protein
MTMANINDDKAQDSLNNVTGDVHDAVNKSADTVSGLAEKASDTASETIGSATSAINDAVDTAQQNISKGISHATETARDISAGATDRVKKFPLRTVLLVAISALTIGFLAGVIRSRRD